MWITVHRCTQGQLNGYERIRAIDLPHNETTLLALIWPSSYRLCHLAFDKNQRTLRHNLKVGREMCLVLHGCNDILFFFNYFVLDMYSRSHHRSVNRWSEIDINAAHSNWLFCWYTIILVLISLRWRHNERDGVSNDRCLDGLLNRLFWRRSTKTSKLRVTGLCAGISPVTDRWIPLNNEQRGKCFHLMTLSYHDSSLTLGIKMWQWF